MFLPTATSSCSVVSRDRLKSAFELGATFVDLMFSFSTRFNAFRLTQEETALFCALMLISPGTTALLKVAFFQLLSSMPSYVDVWGVVHLLTSCLCGLSSCPTILMKSLCTSLGVIFITATISQTPINIVMYTGR